MSIVGRNMLLQSIFYGSFRYWFFSLCPDGDLVDTIETDAKMLLWAASPMLQSNEAGTAQKSKRYMHELASYRPRKSGGGGVMHLPSHIKAFQAQWIIKYLDPRDAPWKRVLDHWILSDDQLGRGTVLCSRGQSRLADRLPANATYIRACFHAFQELGIKQDLSLVSHATEGEPLWFNNRFHVDLDQETKKIWSNDLETVRLSDLLNADGRFSTSREWDAWYEQFAPEDLDDEDREEWIHDRSVERPMITVPKKVKKALLAPQTVDTGEIIAVKHGGNIVYLKVGQKRPDGRFALSFVDLDASGYVRDRGVQCMPLSDGMLFSKTAVWTSLNKHYRTPFAGEDATEPKERDSIIGPTTTAFPLNEGWYATGQTPRKTKPTRAANKQQESDSDSDDSNSDTDDTDAAPRCLSDLTIKAMTKVFTSRLSKDGVSIEDARPNCEARWAAKWPRPYADLLRSSRHWDTIWGSIGTPFSDPTEEKAWCKLLHRAWNAANRHPTAPHHDCRLGCGDKDESMLHMLTCPHTTQLWRTCATFTNQLLNYEKGKEQGGGSAPGPPIRDHPAAILFNTVGKKLLPEQARAFLRHALGQYYAEATWVQEHGTTFRWQRVYARALSRFRDAVIRWAKKI